MVQVLRTTLTNYQHMQSGSHPPSSMFYLVGTLNLLATLLQNGGRDVIDAAIGRRSATDSDSPYNRFLTQVYQEYLYSVPTLQHKQAWPLCRHPKEREAAFRVLHQLTAHDDPRTPRNTLLVTLAKQFRRTVSLDKVGWKVRTTPTQRPTRFAGLNNQGTAATVCYCVLVCANVSVAVLQRANNKLYVR